MEEGEQLSPLDRFLINGIILTSFRVAGGLVT